METRITALAVAIFLGWSVAPAKAAPILSDDFSYPDNASLQAVWGPNATLDPGLTFGSLATSGNSLSLTDPNSYYGDPGVAASRSLGPGAGTYDSSNPSADPIYQSAIWSSYLIQPNSTVYAANPYGSPGTTLGAFYSQSNGSGHELISNPAFSPSYYATQQFAGDNNQAGTPPYTVSAGTTYMVISNLTLNGVAYAYSGAVVTANQYLFTVSAFNNWVAAGKDPATLGSFAVSTTSYNYDTTFGFYVLDSSSLINLQAYVGSADFGNLFVGTTLDDVTPTPEPGTTAVAAVIAWFTLVRPKRRIAA